MNTALLKSRMALSGVNQTQLAKALHRTDNWVSRAFNGKAEFRLDDIRILKEVLSLTPEQIDDIFLS